MIDYSFSYGDLEYFLLILMRVASFVAVAPVFGMQGVPPNRIKVGFAIMLSMLLYGMVPMVPLEYDSVLGYAIIVLKEVLVGIFLGFSAQIVTTITAFAGNVVDMQVGLSMVSLFDPISRNQVTISGTIYQYTLLAMMLISGMYRFILAALTDSFTLIPVNGAVLRSDSILASVMTYLTNYIIIGFRICMPVFIITFIINVVLGVLAKVAPQMNMFAVGIQIKLLVGLGIMYLTAVMLGSASDFVFRYMKEMLNNMTRAMMP
ncbi:MAG: flagellar biosynthetic protein FliR [Lachnospiraceae bacterium]|jgi:flagellar biosynthetic protein FliR|nr:flagellar biosynthetic protein FliR [Lachnospiraceae bacterium]